MQEVIMDFDEQDQPVITVKGVKGAGCKALTAGLEEDLGEVVSDTPTREMRETEVKHGQRVHNRG
jgi:hypothetical protein